MSTVLTQEAAEGFDWSRRAGLINENAGGEASAACPYLNSSAAAMAWHLGRHLCAAGEKRPTPDAKPRDQGRIAVTMGRGTILNVRGYADTLLCRYLHRNDNTFTELR